jgi:hypothetical protein
VSLLVLPAFIPVVAHWTWLRHLGLTPTGFIQYDMPYYMANAREAFDPARGAGGFTPWYESPFSASDTPPRLHFQPLPFTLGLARV